jgi:hypothetical protein
MPAEEITVAITEFIEMVSEYSLDILESWTKTSFRALGFELATVRFGCSGKLSLRRSAINGPSGLFLPFAKVNLQPSERPRMAAITDDR